MFIRQCKFNFPRLAKPRVPNHPTYDPRKLEQVDGYYYSLVLLFVPFRDENDLLLSNETPEQAFNRYNSEGLLGHHEKLMKMLEAMTTRQKITEARKEVDVSKDDGNDNCGPEIVGRVKSDYDKIIKLDACQDPLDLPTRVSMLNADQKRVDDRITGHLLHQQKHEDSQCQCSNLKPLQMFVSGVGGTGKSFLIEAIRTFVKNTWPGLDNTTAVAAPTGLAACNVSGVTTYQLFQLPVEHDSKTAQYWALPKDSLKFLRMQLNNVKVFIIDEVSMVSSLNLAYVHLRLEEIFGGEFVVFDVPRYHCLQQVDGRLMISSLYLLYTHHRTARHRSAYVYDVKCNDPLNKLYFQSSMNQSVSTEPLFPTIFYACLYVVLCGYECS